MSHEDGAVITAARAGDESAFSGLVRRYRPELQVHCYRMVGSVQDSEDLVQETFLRAWRKRADFAGRATFRAWLYRIATNACLDFLDRQPAARRVAVDPGRRGRPPIAIDWLSPYPDTLLEAVPDTEVLPEAAVVSRETIELAFLAAIQHLPPRQRAVLVLRDVLGWPANDTADALDMSVAAVNSALQRARPALRELLPERRTDWARSAHSIEDERAVLRRLMAAVERADGAAIGELLSDDALCGQRPGAGGNMTDQPVWYQGRDVIVRAWTPLLDDIERMPTRHLLTGANGCPAAAMYLRRPGREHYDGFALSVYRIEAGMVAEVDVFGPDLIPLFGLPATL